MKIVIPIVPATLDFIESLNGGVRPKIQEMPTFFLYEGTDTPPDIVSYRNVDKYLTHVPVTIYVYNPS